ncbi:hypothetical protein HK102_006784, partial [Quaeritorhiza haematococci]
MEYCEKKTLRDVIDEGLSLPEPSNVFLDRNDNVKIGDFGLATTARAEAGRSQKTQAIVETTENSRTSDVGTPFYTAPEILSTGRYNAKVDLYSLGICFFEMIYPFSTGMQRATVLRELRQHIKFPEDFDQQKFSNQFEIIRMEEEELEEAFRSIVNNQNVGQYSRLISTLFQKTVTKHGDIAYDFNSGITNADQLQTYCLVLTKVRSIMQLLLENHGAVEITSPMFLPKTTNTAYATAGSIKNVELVDSSGTVVQLPTNGTFPFARFIARVPPFHGRLKRYAFEYVFRNNVAGGQPRRVLECDFDVISSRNPEGWSSVAEAETIKVATEIIDAFPQAATEYLIIINHSAVLDVILTELLHCPVDAVTRGSIYSVLEQYGKMKTGLFRNQMIKILTSVGATGTAGSSITATSATTTLGEALGSTSSLSSAASPSPHKLKLSFELLDHLMSLRGDIDEVIPKLIQLPQKFMSQGSTTGSNSGSSGGVVESGLREFFSRGPVRDAIAQLRSLESNLLRFGVKRRVVFAPMLCYNTEHYRGNMMFQIGKITNKRV